MHSKAICLSAMLLLSGCAATLNSKYTPISGSPTATIRLIANTNSTGTMGRHYNFSLSTDNTCTAGRMTSLGGKLIAKDHEELPPTAIPATEPISVVVVYREGRPGQMRSCGNVARFVPQQGHDYQVLFDVTQQSLSCAISVQDGAAEPVFLEPSDDCFAQTNPGQGPIPNGKALVTNIQVRVQTYR